MNKFRFTIQILAVAIFMFAFASLAQAQATRTWVSGVGDDVNPCSRTAPCKTFAGAISKTALGGEINCLDPGGFGALTVTKSITVDCHEVFASVLHSAVNGFIINFDAFNQATDIRKTVRVRNINFNGAGTTPGVRGIRILGGATNSANSRVYIEDCLLDGNFSAPGLGIVDERVGNANVFLGITNTTVRNMFGAGVQVLGTVNTRVSINRSLISNCAFGVAATGGSQVNVYETLVVGNSGPGIQADAAATIEVDHSLVNNNVGVGFVANGSNSAIRVSNTTAVRNSSLATISGGGTVSSYGNNQTGGQVFPSAGTNQT